MVGWANSSVVNPTSLAKTVLGCQKDGSPTYLFLFTLVALIKDSKATGNK